MLNKNALWYWQSDLHKTKKRRNVSFLMKKNRRKRKGKIIKGIVKDKKVGSIILF